MYLGYQNEKIKFYTKNPLDKKMYNLDRVEETTNEYILVNDEYVLKSDEKAVNQAKSEKIDENDTARDNALIQGVEYKGVLFDSDDAQKINLLATYDTMSDTDTIIWFGMDNQPLECTKNDLLNIGGLIANLHTFCWTKNYETKMQINNASTVDEVNSIEINYNMGAN